MIRVITVFYDNEPNYGVNATCVDWAHRNEFFNSMAELRSMAFIEYGNSVRFVEITAENYPKLCADGVFNV